MNLKCDPLVPIDISNFTRATSCRANKEEAENKWECKVGIHDNVVLL